MNKLQEENDRMRKVIKIKELQLKMNNAILNFQEELLNEDFNIENYNLKDSLDEIFFDIINIEIKLDY